MNQISVNDVQRSKIASDDTQSTKRSLRIEQQLKQSLVEATSLIVDRVSNNINENDATATIRNDFYKTIFGVMRAGIEAIYIMGATYSNDAADSIYYTTETDIQNIKRLSEEATDLYFSKIYDFIMRERQIDYLDYLKEIQIPLLQQYPSITIQNPKFLKEKKSFKIENNIINIVTTVSTRAMNWGIVSKSRQLIDISIRPETPFQFKTKSFALSEYELALMDEGQGALQDEIENNLNMAREANRQNELNRITIYPSPSRRSLGISNFVIWVTANDDKVCPYCRSQEGEIFDLNNRNMLIPPDSSHYHCRCKLLNISESGNVLIDSDLYSE